MFKPLRYFKFEYNLMDASGRWYFVIKITGKYCSDLNGSEIFKRFHYESYDKSTRFKNFKGRHYKGETQDQNEMTFWMEKFIQYILCQWKYNLHKRVIIDTEWLRSTTLNDWNLSELKIELINRPCSLMAHCMNVWNSMLARVSLLHAIELYNSETYHK